MTAKPDDRSERSAWVTIGAVLALAGLVIVGWQSLPSDSTRDLSLPAGVWWVYDEVRDLSAGDTLVGSVQLVAPGEVTLLVMDAGQYGALAGVGPTSSSPAQLSKTGSQLDYSFTAAVGGSYHLIVVHGAGYEDQDQQFQLTTRIPVNRAFVAFGEALLVAGAVVGVGGFVLSKRGTTRAAARPGPRGSSVKRSAGATRSGSRPDQRKRR